MMKISSNELFLSFFLTEFAKGYQGDDYPQFNWK